jgi:hypothetical protein
MHHVCAAFARIAFPEVNEETVRKTLAPTTRKGRRDRVRALDKRKPVSHVSGHKITPTNSDPCPRSPFLGIPISSERKFAKLQPGLVEILRL